MLVFRIDKKLLQRRPPRLTFAGTLATLCRQIESGDYDANLVVDILNENLLLPYIIGHTKNHLDISLGRNTNASKIGDIIVSEECIRGTYDLCIAFLEFVLATISSPNYRDTTRTMLASVTYILNEIYTSHHIWSYKRPGDCNKIMSLCMDIFNQILKGIKDTSMNDSKYSDLEIVCIIGLSQNQAHKQLLSFIVEGKASKKVRWSDESDLLEKTAETTLGQDIDSLKQALFIFNQLISHSKNLKDFCDFDQAQLVSVPLNNYQHGVSSSSTPLTNIERAIFDTSIRPGLLQHLFRYLYQKSDSQTACLAADLIKNIAKKFSMSLMTCLGSEADKVCRFFIDCLSHKERNIDVEVAILDLLSTCVKHQPGLIEMFLNFKQESQITKDGKENKEAGSKSLEVVMNLLKDCRQKDDKSHKLLHSYVMKFILTFWQKNHSAIDQFARAEEFWESVTNPLSKFVDNHDKQDTRTTDIPSLVHTSEIQALDDKLTSYSFMILAREIFCTNARISDRKMSPNLEKLIKDLGEKHLLRKYSSHLRKKYNKVSSINMDRFKDLNRILEAWRDFLTSFAKFQPFEISTSLKNLLIEDLLSCISNELRLNEKLDKERITAAGDTLLLVWTKWMTKDSCGDEILKSIHEIVYMTDSIKEYLPFSFLLTFQTTLNMYLVRNRTRLTHSKRAFDLLVPAVQLMQFSLHITEKYVNQQRIEFEQKPRIEVGLCLASIMTLRFILDVSRNDVNLMISYLQTNLRADSLVQFFSLLMSKRTGSEICFSLVELLLCLASIKETADYLNKATLVNQVNLIVVSAYERPYAHLSQLTSTNTINKVRFEDVADKRISSSGQTETGITPVPPSAISDTTKIYLDTMNSDHDWLPIYWHVIRLNISMISTLGTDYMTAAVEFLSTHCLRICEILELLRTKPRSINMEEVLQMIYLINLVLRHGWLWKKKNKQTFEMISEETAKTAYTLATSALPPPTGSHLDGQQHTSIKPRDCLVYARCCYDFGKYTEAERVLFQTKFGDKNGFIDEAPQIYGEELSIRALHLAALICVKTNRQSDAIDFSLRVLEGDPKYMDVVNCLMKARS